MTRSARVDLAQTARRVADLDALWRPLIRFDPITRYYARLDHDADYEAWLLTWLPGQGTAWHDHGDSSGSFIVLEGRLTEEVGARPVGGELHCSGIATHHRPGSQRTFGSSYLHKVTNNDVEPAVSLHLYSPALTQMNEYVEVDGLLEAVYLQRVGQHW